ncbi:MAG: serine/threonine protein kinase [Archangiaceae bacterium]|nr:serine/threonine protein kinase [Archangiaceae bacterium]
MERPHLDEDALIAFMQGSMAPEAVAAVEEHLDRCDACRKLATSMVKATVPAGAPQRAERPTLLERGTAVGRYVVLEPLGAGSMGVVYAAYDPALDRKISLKLLRSDLAHPDLETARARLEREARAMARLSHPNVAIVHDVGSFRDQLFVAMEYVEGGTLESWLAQQRRPWRAVLSRFVDAGRGLQAAHAAGLVHRDFKPANVLVRNDGSVRVSDFGLASSGAGGLSPRELVGTPVYMSPEQLSGASADARSDQFSFCVALYEGLYGVRPFAADSVPDLLEAVAHTAPAPPAPSAVPGWLKRVVLRGLYADPAQRWPDMTALLEALSRDPARTRWRVGAALIAAVGCVGAVAWLASANARHLAACRTGAAPLAGIWDDAQRAKLKASFSASPAPYAAAMLSGTSRTLDTYAAAWVAMNEEACIATRVRTEQSEEVLQLRVACLGERRQQLAALTALLASADPAVVEKARVAAEALEPLARCEAKSVLTRPVFGVPPGQRAAVAEVREHLAVATALLAAGRYAASRERASAVMIEARATGYLPLEVETRLVLARASGRGGDPATAEDELYRAISAAERAGDTRALARGWVDLVYVQGYQRAQEQAGRRAANIAEGLLERLGGDEELAVWLHNNLGAIERNANRLEEAQRHFELAATTYQRLHGADAAMLGSFVGNLGAVLQMRGRYSEALAADTRAVELFRAELGPQHPDTASALNNLGLVYEDLGELPKALETYRRALEVREAALGPKHPQVVTSLNNVCVAEIASGAVAAGLATCERAVALGTEVLGPDHPNLGALLNSLASAQKANRQLDAARATLLRALSVREKRLGPEHASLAYDLVALAQLDLEQGDVKGALPRATRAVNLREHANSDPVLLAVARFTRARALWAAQGDRDRPRQLLAAARAALAAGGPHGKKDLEALDAWVAAHPEAGAVSVASGTPP